MTKMDLKKLIPKHKFDIETTEKLKEYSYEQVKPIIPELLTWIQDGHWYVAAPVADFLVPFANHITEELLKILRTNDAEWEFQCLRYFGFETNDIELKNEITRIALNPTQNEIEGEAQQKALECLKYWKTKK
jgi:hypothetical protein